MERLPPDLRAALNQLADEVDTLADAVKARTHTYRMVLAAVVASLLLVGSLAYANRSATCDVVTALGALDDQVAGEPPATDRARRLAAAGDRFAGRYRCPRG